MQALVTPPHQYDLGKIDSVCIDKRGLDIDCFFKVGSSDVSATPEFIGFTAHLDSLQRYSLIKRVSIIGKTSPEGRAEFNHSLGYRRAMALRDFIVSRSCVPDSTIILKSVGEDWDDLMANLGKWLSPDKASEIASIIENEQDLNRRETLIRAIDGGKTWKTLINTAFSQLRRATAGVELVPVPECIEECDGVEQIAYATAVDTVYIVEPDQPYVTEDTSVEAVPAASGCQKGWHVSTNAIEWGLLIANATGEWDFQCHWSLAASLHYSALNYFTSTRKFRTFILRPEARYWFSDAHAGLFVDAHVQMASYNFALSHWSYRIQDFDGKHPALGGGIGCGYRMPVGTNGHWALQAQIGVGAYLLKYNKFENKPNGKLVATRSRNWCGIDNVALSIVYNFNAVNQ